MSLILRWLVSAAAVGAAAYLLEGVRVEGGAPTLLVVALILGLVNALARPVLRALACGLIFLTLGLFLFVINAALLLLSAAMARSAGFGFHVDGFATAVAASVLISVVSFLLSLLLPGPDRHRHR